MYKKVSWNLNPTGSHFEFTGIVLNQTPSTELFRLTSNLVSLSFKNVGILNCEGIKFLRDCGGMANLHVFWLKKQTQKPSKTLTLQFTLVRSIQNTAVIPNVYICTS